MRGKKKPGPMKKYGATFIFKDTAGKKRALKAEARALKIDLSELLRRKTS